MLKNTYIIDILEKKLITAGIDNIPLYYFGYFPPLSNNNTLINHALPGIVLSRTKAITPPTVMLVLRRLTTAWLTVALPVIEPTF